MTIGINSLFSYGMKPLNGFQSSPFVQNSQSAGTLESVFNFSGFSQGYPIDFTQMMQNWNENQSQIQKMFMAILSTMAFSVPHMPKPQVRPLDYSKYEKSNADKIVELDPQMQQKTMQLLDFAKNKLGVDVKITSGYRTKEEQAYLIQKTPHLAAKNSAHCEGKAVDISISGKPGDDEATIDNYYKELGNYAKSIGMRWGGDFSKQKERWHFDYNWR